MQLNQLPPLSKDQLLHWLITFSNQLSKGTFIVDIHDRNLSILHANDYLLRLTNYELHELINLNLSIFNGSRTNNDSITELITNIRLGLAKKFTVLHYTKNGSAFWNSITIHPIKDSEQTIQYVLLTCEDTTEAELNKMVYKLEHEVYEAIDNEDNLQSILSLISKKIEKFYIYDVYCTIHIYDKNYEIKSLGSYNLPVDVIHELDLLTVTPNMSHNPRAVYVKDISAKSTESKDINFNIIKGSWTKPILTSQNETIGILTLFLQDDLELKQSDTNYLNRLALLIQLSIKYAEQKIELSYLAFYDIETKLPNLQFFKGELAKWIDAGFTGYVAVIHPTEFNKIIDLYGRNAGAELLRQMADRMCKFLPSGDEIIARFSNSIILAKKAPLNSFHSHRKHVEPLTQVPFVINGEENYITLKTGYTTFTSTMTVEQCIHQIDIALTNARKINGTSFSMYEENSINQLTEEMNIFNQLTYGINNKEFEVYLQPKINFKTNEVEGFEALSRWNSSKLGFVSPIKYISIAEQSGKIKDIDLLNLTNILQWLQQRIDTGKKIVPIALNISPDHFYEPYFLDNIIHTFNQFRVPPKYIKLEVTESIELVDFIKAKSILEKLNELGIESSIDDFGVGFSSLSYLPKLPFSEIKIDRSFVNSMNEPGMYAVVQTIIQLANNINMRPIAEGIETKDQLAMLQQLGCPAGQGYYFYKPMTKQDAEILLDQSNS
ncbi:EAL domain-containing protein [Solibacillus sp. MA9]|uniref:EAL domain-containing protein n=1 Tax=Solibacillus palustris TaxID=2908203 RepID=A0ABS9UBE5_9BACL|nr:EAL domain-containing protein [Solibacillus sp. MA9]MCH7321666.1 EAL domain-containing protein [Solibacillus sp. MA9]